MTRSLRLSVVMIVVGLVASSCLSIDTTVPPRNLNLPGRASGYDYAPTVMHMVGEEKPYKIWFCAQEPKVAGNWNGPSWDVIMHAESSSPNGPWSEPTVAFRPTENTGSFDEDHTCDPSVVQHGNHFYLYYGGLRDSLGADQALGHIGIAKSSDAGRTFEREQTEPLIKPYRRTCDRPEPISRWQHCYGAGQPSVVKAGRWFYMVYYDDTGAGGNAQYGGLYMIRSRSPLFTDPQHLVNATADVSTWEAGTSATSALLPTSVSLPNVDVMLIRETREFLVLGRNGSFVLTPDGGGADGPRSIDYEEFAPWSLTINSTDVETQDGYGFLRNRFGQSLEMACLESAIGVMPVNVLDLYIAAGAIPYQASAVSTWDLTRQRGFFQQERNTTSCSSSSDTVETAG